MKTKSVSLVGALLAVSLATIANAQQVPSVSPGTFPLTFDSLPPGQLKQDLSRLPPQAQDRALAWLNGFSFPDIDFNHLRVDRDGGIFYVDGPVAIDTIDPASVDPVASGVTASEVFSLHSKPGAPNVLFVDVDGHVLTGSAWNSGNVDPLYATPFDTDGNQSTFSDVEIDQIAEIWYRIAEDFSAFDVDVTTEDPGNMGPNAGRILITPNIDAYGNAMPSSGAGGVAYVGVFGTSYYSYYSPALVYSNNLANFPPYIAEAASHEAGHNLGLSHDGTTTTGYYPGHGSGAISWGPIMGTGYYDNVSQWSQGEYAQANNFQDDIQIMTNVLGARADDHADTPAGATSLAIDATGLITSTTPQTDPFALQSSNKGVIGTRTDTDWFGFAAGAGPARLQVTPSWAAWTRSSGGRGTNLDVEMSLVDEFGNTVAWAEPTDETNASIDVTLAAGYYYLGITGVGNTFSPYSDYGSQGQYFIEGQVTPDTAEPPPSDTTPPSPDPMSFASVPTALDHTRITMTASTAIDETGSAVEYLFSSDAGISSGWTGSTTYTAIDLAPATRYDWQVKARDAAGNETTFSAVASATTDTEPTPPEPPVSVSDLAATDNTDGTATLNWSDVAGATDYEIYRESWHTKRKRWYSLTLVASVTEGNGSIVDASGNGDFRYFIRSINGTGSADSAWVTVTVTTAGGSGGGGNGGCKGGPRKCP